MFLTPEQVDSRLSSPRNLVNIASKQDSQEDKVEIRPFGDRSNPRPPVPTSIKNTAAILNGQGVSLRQVSSALGVSRMAACNYSNGKRGVEEDVVEKALGKVRDVALEKLMFSMGLLTPEKLEKCSAKDLSGISSNMARVVEKTIPNKPDNNFQTNLIIYAPEVRKEESFRVVEV